MYCRNCGKQLGPGTNFCPACGTKIVADADLPREKPSDHERQGASSTNGAQSTWAAQGSERLVRPRSPRVLGGVCAAFALQYGWNLDLVRIATAILGLFYGVGILAYVACWILIPEAQYALPSRSR